MKILLTSIAILISLTGCSRALVETKDVYIAQKTKVEVVSCDTRMYHDEIAKLSQENNASSEFIGSSMNETMWKLIDTLYNCIERQKVEIESKQ